MDQPPPSTPPGDMTFMETYMGQSMATYSFREKVPGFYKEVRSQPYSILLFAKSAFLPDGYPESVSEDYLEYQIWDTIQVCSLRISVVILTGLL